MSASKELTVSLGKRGECKEHSGEEFCEEHLLRLELQMMTPHSLPIPEAFIPSSQRDLFPPLPNRASFARTRTCGLSENEAIGDSWTPVKAP
mgnify:CR=1 FL=1